MLVMDVRGTSLVTLSAASFGLMSVLAKDGATAAAGVTTVLVARFLLAALLFGALAAARGARPADLPRSAVLVALGLGVLYAAESTIFFSALGHLDASIASLVLCTYPAVVLVLAVALRRERASARKLGALGLALGGAGLVLATGVRGQLDGVGLGLAAGSTVLYASYVTIADGVSRQIDDPLAFGGLLSAGAFAALLAGGLATGRLHPGVYADGAVAGHIVLMASVSTVLAVAAFVAGMQRVGATTASIVASVEPLFTVALAAVLLGETLTPVQLLGGAVLLGGILLVQAPEADTLAVDGPSARPAGPAPARALALEPA